MPKSKSRRKGGVSKKYVQRDSAGNPVRAKDNKHIRNISVKQIMRMQTLNSACESLTSAEVQTAIDAGKGYELSYVSTVLDDGGVPISGDTLTIRLANIDIDRLKSILKHKGAAEETVKETE